MFQIGDVITCRRTRHDKHPGQHVNLTKGNEYEVTNLRMTEVEVRNDLGDCRFYSQYRFFPLDTMVEVELNTGSYKSRAEQGEFKAPDED